MARLVALAVSLLFTASQAVNPLFLSMGSPQCDRCLDQSYYSCPGDYETRPFAECMCGGDGATLYASECVPLCADATGLGASYFVLPGVW